tara:strand:- start:6391 stop:7224 length:834 start_codon:yes stop_codon:yes gene_type:complete
MEYYIKKSLYEAMFPRLFLILILFFLFAKSSYADIRRTSFPNKNKPSIYIFLGGNYKSDYNSKDYILNFGSRYKNKNQMHELKLYNKVTEGHTTTKSMRKTKELYEVELSNKIVIGQTKNYFNLYNLFEQDKYDNFTSSEELIFNSDEEGYYNRITSLAGLGRVFSKNFEAEFNIGSVNSKGEGSQIALNPVLYLKKKINKKLKISSKISRIKQQKTQDDYFSFSITQKINKNIAISLYHKYKKSQYIYRKENSRVNIREVRKRSDRSLTLNLKYYL